MLGLLVIAARWLFCRIVNRELRAAQSRQYPLVTAAGMLALTLLS